MTCFYKSFPLSSPNLDYVNLLATANKFDLKGEVVAIEHILSGTVNQTFLLTLKKFKATEKPHYILQKINTHVFKKPECLMSNLQLLGEYVEHNNGLLECLDRSWSLPKIIPTHDGRDCIIDEEGGFWRVLTYIENGQAYETIQNTKHAFQVGTALGWFHKLLRGLDTNHLQTTINGFHNTTMYLNLYGGIRQKNASLDVAYCNQFIEKRHHLASMLEQSSLSVCTIHGDPKAGNVIINNDTGNAISIIDLDTIGRGKLVVDIGDCLRSCCNIAGQNPDNFSLVDFNLDVFNAILMGYHLLGRGFLTDCDYSHIYNATHIIAFELGVRFFADYLSGNLYFTLNDNDDERLNLYRALVQFKLTESIERQKQAIMQITNQIKMCNDENTNS